MPEVKIGAFDVAWTQIVALAANLLACFRHLALREDEVINTCRSDHHPTHPDNRGRPTTGLWNPALPTRQTDPRSAHEQETTNKTTSL